jgi:PAS domain S-box-containing protein
MHKLLERQIRRHLNPDGSVPAELRPLLEAVDQAYRDGDADRALLERSLDLSSKELSARYQDLRQQQRETQVIFDSAPAMIFYKDTQNRILRLNEMAARALGRPHHELVGRSLYELFPADVARRLHDDDLEVARSGLPKLGIIESHPEAGGRTVWYRTDKVPFRDESGQVAGIIVFSLDVSDQKRAEEQIQRANQQLEELVRFRTQFLNTTAHELRTPLTPIILQSHLLRESFWADADETQRRGFEILERNVARLDRLVSDVLDAARLQAGRLQLQRRRMDMMKLASQAVETFTTVAAQAHVSLELVPGEPVELEGDGSRLTQVLYNLLSNAIKFTPAGGKVVVECKRQGEHCLVNVQDTGVGILMANASRLFQPFTQLHNTMERTSGGTGLGLFVSRGIVEEHGGQIWCFSAGPDTGSTFSLRLPLAAPPASVSEPAAEAAAPRRPVNSVI